MDASNVQALGTPLLEAKEIGSILTIVFCLGALILNYLLYRTELVPRWLSGCGLIAIVPYLAAGLLSMFGIINALSPIYALLNLLLALQEMVLAVWLIVRGFNSSATVFRAAKTEPNAVYVSTFDTPRMEETAAASGLTWAGLVIACGVPLINDAGVVARE